MSESFHTWRHIVTKEEIAYHEQSAFYNRLQYIFWIYWWSFKKSDLKIWFVIWFSLQIIFTMKKRKKFQNDVSKNTFILYILYILQINPFPHTTIMQQTTLNVFCQNIENLHTWMDNLWQKVEEHCGKRRNCTFCAISSFVTMLSKSYLLQRRQKASIWGKGLWTIFILLIWIISVKYSISVFTSNCHAIFFSDISLKWILHANLY